MGFYVDPQGQNKEEWLAHNALEVTEQEVRDGIAAPNYGGTTVYVCYVVNQLFTAAGIAVDRREGERFLQDDGRHKIWFVVDRARVVQAKFMPDNPNWRETVL